MSVAVKSVHSRPVKATLRADRFYIFDDADTNESEKTKCINNGTQTKSDHSKYCIICLNTK